MGNPRLTGAIRKEIEKEERKVRTLREVLADAIDKMKFGKAVRTQREIVRQLLRIDGKKIALLVAEQAEGLGEAAVAIAKEVQAEQQIVDELVKELDLLLRAGKVDEAARRGSALQAEVERIGGKTAAKDIAGRLLESRGKKKKTKTKQQTKQQKQKPRSTRR